MRGGHEPQTALGRLTRRYAARVLSGVRTGGLWGASSETGHACLACCRAARWAAVFWSCRGRPLPSAVRKGGDPANEIHTSPRGGHPATQDSANLPQ